MNHYKNTMSRVSNEFLDVRSMKLVLSIYNDNSFASTQAYIFTISSFLGV